MNAFIDKYLKIERLGYEVFKEVGTVTLVFFLAYRILAEVPIEGSFDDWSRTILLVAGYLMIPGMVIKVYLFVKTYMFVTGMTKDK